jgi:DNA-binding response OmpR family regulator
MSEKNYPEGWARYVALMNSADQDIPKELAVWAARFRAAKSFRGISLEGMSDDAEKGYFVGLKLTLVDTALEAFERVNPDLVLLDVMLPGIDGIEVCRRIREISGTPIVMITAKNDDADVVTGLEMGADDYIVKPCATNILIARVRARLRPTPASLMADATYSDEDDDEAGEAEGDRLWQAKSEKQSVKQEQSSSHALTVLHVKCEEVAQEVRRARRRLLRSAASHWCQQVLKKEKIKLTTS